MPRVVIDTNVVVSANLNDTGLEAIVVSFALTGSLQLYVSDQILDEYERVLHYPRLKFLRADIQAFMKKVRHVAIIVAPKQTLYEAKHDADNRFLECAETAKAEYLVTGNRRHFPPRWKGVEIVSARELLMIVLA